MNRKEGSGNLLKGAIAMFKKYVFLSVLLPLLIIQCTSDDSSVIYEGDSVFIEDRTGRKWDISHAVQAYSMNPNYFNFGIGVGRIPSVDNPKIFSEGDAGYPGNSANISIFGVIHDGEKRGYPVSHLSRHEVFNENYPQSGQPHVSVAY